MQRSDQRDCHRATDDASALQMLDVSRGPFSNGEYTFRLAGTR